MVIVGKTDRLKAKGLLLLDQLAPFGMDKRLFVAAGIGVDQRR